MQPEDVLDLAYRIYKNHDSEAAYRASIGRSYYSTFYPARNAVNRLGLQGAGNTHERVISAFQGQHPTIHNALGSLFSDRVAADYHLGEQVSASRAKAALSKAKTLHQKIGEL
ncbi:hypothetical protein [Kushneria aurantia]|uniref:HEPN domain-containing protein n=1 Tax=Kushneria aurantia TaxID=504092 RepID=A0ABV6G4K1_9GAMM|nr:hypothetical protein [Kushneria aurantia]